MQIQFDEYLKYIKGSTKNYSQKLRDKILDNLISKELVKKDSKKDIHGALDISEYKEEERLDKCLELRPESIKVVEEFEFIKNYKYSVIYFMNDFKREIFHEKIYNGSILRYSDDTNSFDYLGYIFDKPTFYDRDELLFLKFSIKCKMVHPQTGDEHFQKYPIIVAFWPNINVVEIRFDAINELYMTNQNFYSYNIDRVLGWIQLTLGIHTQIFMLESTIQDIIKNKKDEVKCTGQNMKFSDGSQACLEAGNNGQYVLPFLGELKEIIAENEKEFEKAPRIKDLLEQFIQEKVETADFPWVTLKWLNEKKGKCIDVRFTFNYKGTDICLLQHLVGQIGMERMNHVTRYLVENRKVD